MTWLAVGLAALLVVLAVLQYRWVGQVSDAEREQLRASVQRRGQEFAMELHLELARVFATFQTPPVNDEDVDAQISRAWAHWTRDARYPHLVRDVYFVEPAREAAAERFTKFDPRTSRLESAEWPEVLAPLRARFAEEATRAPVQGDGIASVIRRHSPLVDDVPALVIPSIRLRSNPATNANIAIFTLQTAMAYTIATIDVDYLRRELLPALTKRHFNAADAHPDFIVSVVKARTPTDVIFQSESAPLDPNRADFRHPLLELRGDEIGRVVLEHQATAARGGGGRAVAGGFRPAQKSQSTQLRFALGMQKDVAVRRTAPSAGGGAWQLLVTHRAGSVDAAIRAARSRNLTISFGILLLFGVSIGLLVVSTERARRLAERQMEFVAAVSHELRTPLAVIRSAGENLADGVVAEQPQVQKYGRLIEEQGRSLSEMVEQVLVFAGAETGQRPPATERVDLSAVLTGVIDTARQLAGPSFTVESAIAADLPGVDGHPDALRRACQNLIDNAVKYSGDAKWVRVEASGRGHEVVVTVADRGLGIDSSEQRRIFEPFYRGRRATAAQIHGSGLGLSLVQRIAHAHRGSVRVTSAPGQGSTFTLSLPAAATLGAQSAPLIRSGATDSTQAFERPARERRGAEGPPQATEPGPGAEPRLKCQEFSSSKTNPASS